MSGVEELEGPKNLKDVNGKKVKVRVFRKENKLEANSIRDESLAMTDDPFASYYSTDGILKPPFNLFGLATMPEICPEMVPAIDAMKVNIEMMGHRILPRPGILKDNEETPANVVKEKNEVWNFFENSVLDDDIGTFEELKSRLRMDQETTGNNYTEVIPLASDPTTPAGFMHLPSWTMRLTKQDEEPTEYTINRAIRLDEGFWEIQSLMTSKRFRRFVQIKENSQEKIYFKEWGDPRPISYKTGKVMEGEYDNEELAHEVIHNKIYSPRTPYGIPRYIGNTYGIYGAREAQIVNYVSLVNNQIPALMLMATNTALTDESLDRIKEFFEEDVQGHKNYSSLVIVESEPVGEGIKDPGSMKMALEKLSDSQNTDYMFKDYIKGSKDDVRRSWRLPPSYVGLVEDFNRSTSEAAKKLAEEQIFTPERNSSDKRWTNVVTRLGYASVVYKSNSPNITDNYELTQLLAVATSTGGMTPRIAADVISDILNREVPDPLPETNPDLPFPMTMLREQQSFNVVETTIDSNKNKGIYSSMTPREAIKMLLIMDNREIIMQKETRKLLQSELDRLGG